LPFPPLVSLFSTAVSAIVTKFFIQYVEMSMQGKDLSQMNYFKFKKDFLFHLGKKNEQLGKEKFEELFPLFQID